MKVINDTFELNSSNIDEFAEKVYKVLSKESLAEGIPLKIKMKMESILLIWREKFSEREQCSIRMYKQWGAIHLKMYKFGVPINPLSQSHDNDLDEYQAFLYNMASDIEENMYYKYSQGTNIIEFKFRVKTKLKFVHKIILGALVGGLSGYALTSALGINDMTFIVYTFTEPLVKALLSLLNGTAMVMIFFSMTAALCNMGNLSTLSDIGGRVMKIFLSRGFLASVVSFSTAPYLFGGINNDSTIDITVLCDIYKMFIDMIPTNMLEPFIQGNAIHLIIIAILIGYSALTKGEKLHSLKTTINDMNILSVDIVNIICKMLPFIVFLSIFDMVSKGSISNVLGMWKMFLFDLVITLGLLSAEFVYVSKKTGLPLNKMIDDILPIFILGATTMSTTPCLSLISKVCKEKYNVLDKINNFTIPFGQNFFRPYECVAMTSYLFFIAETYGVGMSASAFFLLFVSCNILLYSIPTIPMGMMIPFALLLKIAGLPTEAISVVMAVDFISGAIRMSAKAAGMTLETLLVNMPAANKQ